MAFPSTSKTSLAGMWAAIKATSGSIKNRCGQVASASSINRKELLDFANFLADARDTFAAYAEQASTNGLVAYAREQENDPALDVQAEYVAMRNAIVAVQSWIVTNFPKNAQNELCVYTFDGNSRFANISLTGPQITAFKSQVASLAATIA